MTSGLGDVHALSTMARESLAGPTAAPLRVFVLGATGRTGGPFVVRALARGHAVTAVVRSAARLPAEVREHPRMRAVTAELGDLDAIERAVRADAPDVVVSMLASESPPYTAVSTGTRAVVAALRRRPRGDGARPVPLLSIAAWGLGPTDAYVTGVLPRLVLRGAQATFWSRPARDFAAQLAELAQAEREALVRPILIAPPILRDGPPTSTYLAGDAHAMKDVMGVTRVVNRGSIADACLKLTERAAAGAAVPKWVAIREA